MSGDYLSFQQWQMGFGFIEHKRILGFTDLPFVSSSANEPFDLTGFYFYIYFYFLLLLPPSCIIQFLLCRVTVLTYGFQLFFPTKFPRFLRPRPGRLNTATNGAQENDEKKRKRNTTPCPDPPLQYRSCWFFFFSRLSSFTQEMGTWAPGARKSSLKKRVFPAFFFLFIFVRRLKVFDGNRNSLCTYLSRF